MKKVEEILKETSLPAIPRIVHNEHIILKIIWFACLIGLTSVAIYYIYLNIISYLSYNVITNIAVYSETEPEFPMIGICVDIGTLNLTNKSTLLACTFDSINCTYKDFEFYTDGSENDCFLFNSGKNFSNQPVPIKKITRNSIFYGLSLVLQIEKYRMKYKGINKISLYIKNYSNVFDLLQKYDTDTGLLIPPEIINIRIDREFSHNLPSPYNSCILDKTDFVSNLFQQFNLSNKVYSQKDCIEMCVKINMNSSYDIPNLKTKSDDCLTNCPIECNSINYNIFENPFSITDQFKQSYGLANSTSKENLLALNINYKSKQYTLISQIPKMEPFDLVNSFGSLLSLFLGFSFLSLVEIIDITVKMILYFFRKNRRIQIN